ncbi:tRNA 3' processing endoribonuclease [Cymbomonas tetramitiformis]|uniref:tRNA 3' processing endoribonuclease n=1 Tax=Cymbomonas tetramitiformis TaxID=36881 RepID=A0AAE0KQL6_9CHLO|nr:tRNA 3' processing endoribonuclease [Cymbomonas tetramitiformis]
MTSSKAFALSGCTARAKLQATHSVRTIQGLQGSEIAHLRKSGVEVSDVLEAPEVAFTGDTTIDFATCPENSPVLHAKLLIMEVTFLDDKVTVEHARKYGHTHIAEVVANADKFRNEAILMIHFSARYSAQDITDALDNHLPPDLRKRVTPLLTGFS